MHDLDHTFISIIFVRRSPAHYQECVVPYKSKGNEKKKKKKKKTPGGGNTARNIYNKE